MKIKFLSIIFISLQPVCPDLLLVKRNIVSNQSTGSGLKPSLSTSLFRPQFSVQGKGDLECFHWIYGITSNVHAKLRTSSGTAVQQKCQATQTQD